MNLAAVGEFGFIDRIKVKARNSPGVLLGIGDDAAVTAPTPGTVLLTTADLLAERVHFDLTWSEPAALGRKSLAVNLSDIASMGGTPRYALLSLAVPRLLSLEFMDSFMAGFLEMAERYGVSLIGGDTSASEAGFVISVTLMGEQAPDRVVTRSGACCGDLVCVSGTLGGSALGLELLQSGCRSGEAVERHLDPVPRVELGKALAERRIPTAMIDVSDGLCADLGHILAASAKGAKICIDDLPLSDCFRRSVDKNAHNYYRLPLSGGEDYELLFTLHPSQLKGAEEAAAMSGTTVSVIGEITAESGLFLAHADGSRYDAAVACYDHFARM